MGLHELHWLKVDGQVVYDSEKEGIQDVMCPGDTLPDIQGTGQISKTL